MNSNGVVVIDRQVIDVRVLVFVLLYVQLLLYILVHMYTVATHTRRQTRCRRK